MSHPIRSVPGMDSDTYIRAGQGSGADDCDHELRTHGRVGVIACAECGLVEWFGPHGGMIDPAEGVAALYGTYDLIGPMPAVGAPAASVLAYRPPRGRKAALDLLPMASWLRLAPDLWVATDGDVLLLATPDPLMVDNLTRGA